MGLPVIVWRGIQPVRPAGVRTCRNPSWEPRISTSSPRSRRPSSVERNSSGPSPIRTLRYPIRNRSLPLAGGFAAAFSAPFLSAPFLPDAFVSAVAAAFAASSGEIGGAAAAFGTGVGADFGATAAGAAFTGAAFGGLLGFGAAVGRTGGGAVIVGLAAAPARASSPRADP